MRCAGWRRICRNARDWPPAGPAGHRCRGGDFPVDGVAALVERIRAHYPFLAAGHARRLVRAYGTGAMALLDGARSAADLGPVHGADLTQAELRYLARYEWAMTAEDVLWRRSKLGLRLSPAQVAAVEQAMVALAGSASSSVSV